MICKKCLNKLKDSFVGQTNQANETVKRISHIPNGFFILNSSRAIPLYIEASKPISRGKRKGELKEVKGTIFIEASFCPKCGLEFEKEEEKIDE